MKCEHFDHGFCLHDGYLCNGCKSSKPIKTTVFLNQRAKIYPHEHITISCKRTKGGSDGKRG